MKIQNIVLLLFIVLIAAFLRFYQLGINPPSLTWDEAAWGYNAYSLGIDGKDEFGRFLPYDYLESFGDFKPPMYAYLDVAPVKVFGLTPFATRFPSALFGTLTVLTTYFLVKRLFSRITNSHFAKATRDKYELRSKDGSKESRTKNQKNSYVEHIALASALILAVSPWHIMLSRAAFEANVATFFLVTGVWLFLGGVEDKRWYLPLSAVSFVLSMYTFNSARIVAPLLVIILAVGLRKQLLLYKKTTLITGIVGVLLLLPIVGFLLSPQASLRFREVNIFSDPDVVKTANQEIANDNGAWWSKIIHNRRLAYSVSFLQHYFDNLSPDFLFIKGDGNPKFSTQDTGQMYVWDLPFFIVGIFLLLRKREGKWWMIPLWLLAGIIPAATARETPHALRIEATLPTFQIISAYGFVGAISNFKCQMSNVKLRRGLVITSLLLLFLFVMYFEHGYYAHYAREFSGEWQYGYRDSIAYVNSIQDQYDQIDVSAVLGRPYIYYLFFNKTDPNVFRNTAIVHRDAFGFVDVQGFEKYRFANNVNDIPNDGKNILYINDWQSLPKNAHVLKTFYLLNGDPVLKAYTK